jgi:transitional endoplasmic reticulum ATPase
VPAKAAEDSAPPPATTLRLKVAEAMAKDAGRAYARIGPEDMERLGVAIGDIVEVAGKRRTVCKVMPLHKEFRGKSCVQMDGVSRENAGAGVDEFAMLRKVACRTAEHIVLAPVSVAPSGRDIDYIAGLLDGLPVVEGDRVRATLFGSRWVDFKVQSPKGPVLIGPNTQLAVGELLSERVARSVSYEDVGGLKPQLRRIREMIELPLRHPEIFERLGIDAPKGVLLYGPPGCGKTLIARAIAHETEASFFSVSGPEVVHKFYGESEAKLRKIFEEAARKAPSIVFIDEIDAIAPQRERVIGEVEKRIVPQLLALMDGLTRRQNVIVIAATNIPNALDPALRRPGRFDRELAIPIPDRSGRLEMLEIHSRGMPLAQDVDLGHLADITHGFVGADLEALCREAAMLTLRRVMPDLDLGVEHFSYELLSRLEVRMEDFEQALREVEPSAIREVFVEVPDVGWDDVGGLGALKRRLRECVEWPLKYGELFAQARIAPPKGILLVGPPGCGKTLLAKALASESGVNFISVKGPELMSKYVGESERALRDVFRKARQAAPTIIFFDEIDALVPTRGSGLASEGVAERMLSQFLTELDGIEELKGVLVLGATNRVDRLDPAVLRPGRFDEILEIPPLDESDRGEILAVHLRGKPLAAGIDIEELVRRCEGYGGAEIASLCPAGGAERGAAGGGRARAQGSRRGRGAPGARGFRSRLPGALAVTAPAENQALYLFHLTAAESAARAELAVVDDSASIFAHCHAGLAAMLGVVAIDEFCGPEAERKLADLGWMGERAFRHQRVIEQGFQRGPVLPARLGTLFSTLGAVERFIETNRQAITGFLDAVRGQEEWGIKARLERPAARRWLSAQVTAAAAPDEAALSPGLHYLQKRRAHAAADKDMERWLADNCEAVARSLDDHATARRQRPIFQSADPADQRELVLNLAALVPHERRGGLIAHFESINAERAQQGLSFVLSGPWPPYSFCPPLAMPS